MLYGPYNRQFPELDASYMFIRDNIALEKREYIDKTYMQMFTSNEMPKPASAVKNVDEIYKEF